MEIVERTVSEVTVLDLQGRLVAGDGDQALIDAVNALVRNGCRNVLLNLAKVVYLDSAGVGAIVSKYITLRSRGGDLKVCHLRDRSFRVLNVTKLLTVIESFSSEASAIRSFGHRPEAL